MNNIDPILMSRLTPQEKMGRNEKCWCLSGLKWKNCHYNRNLQNRENPYEQLNKFNQIFDEGYCLHPEANPSICSDKIVKAHTIQKNGGLIAIAENHHVLSLKNMMFKDVTQSNLLIPKRLSIRKASTFPGFCGKHDNELFLPAENRSSLVDKNLCALLSFRSICLEYFNKERSLKIENLLRESDKGCSFEYQCELQQYICDYKTGLILGRSDTDKIRSIYSDMFRTRDFSNFHYYAIGFNDILPVVSSGAFFPEWDFTGNLLQEFQVFMQHIEHVAMNITTIKEKSWIIFGWTGNDKSIAWKIAKSFQGLENKEKADAAIKWSFRYIENTYMRETWWDNLAPSIQHILMKYAKTGLPSGPNHNSFQFTDMPSITDLIPIKEIWE